MANAKRYGIRVACLAGIGRLVAFVVMITLAATGLATVLYTSEKLFLAIKVAGGSIYFGWPFSCGLQTQPTVETNLWREKAFSSCRGKSSFWRQGTPRLF